MKVLPGSILRQCDGGCKAAFWFCPDPRDKVPAHCSRCRKEVNWVRISLVDVRGHPASRQEQRFELRF
jgi:hypothetical protein